MSVAISERDQLLTAEQLANRWQVEKAHVYRLARERRLPEGAVVELGRYRRFRLDGVEDFERAGGTTHRNVSTP